MIKNVRTLLSMAPVLLVASATLPAQDAEPTADRQLRFAWPVPCDVQVTEEREKGGRKILSRYRIELRAAATEGQLILRMRDYRFVTINDRDVTGPALRAALAPLEAQTGILPDITLDADGRVAKIEGWDEYYARVEALVKGLGRGKELPEKTLESIYEMMRRPDMQEVLRASAVEFWDLWVGAWLDYDFAESAELEVEGEFPFPNGIVLKAPMHVRHLGAEPGREGFVRLSVRNRLTGDEVRDAMIAMLKGFAANTPGAKPVPDDAITSVDIRDDIWVVLRPGTMQPVEAQAERRSVVEAKDGKKEQIDRRHYKLEWSK